jgi:small subunit ribosomal protein S17
MSIKTTTKNNIEQKGLNGKILDGVVTSDKMTDTIVVKVTRYTKHPKYQKYVTSAKKYKAHDAGNTAKIGDKVKIAETRPISKEKRFTLIEILK